MQTGTSLKGESIALDVDGTSNTHRPSADTYRRQYSYSSGPTSATGDARKRSLRSRRQTEMSFFSPKEQERYRTQRKHLLGYSKAQIWCPAWESFSVKDSLGVLLGIGGIIILLLCLLGTTSSPVRGIYFARVYDRDGSPGEARFGLRGYCITTAKSPVQCSPSTDFVYIPWDVATSEFLNTTFPAWFQDAVTPDQGTDPLATPTPPHDVSVTAAMSISIGCACIAVLCQLARFIRGLDYGDINYTRAFVMALATVTALLSMALSLLIYVNGCKELEIEYPHLQTRKGPCLVMVGTAFGCFLCATILFFDNFLSSRRDGQYY